MQLHKSTQRNVILLTFEYVVARPINATQIDYEFRHIRSNETVLIVIIATLI